MLLASSGSDGWCKATEDVDVVAVVGLSQCVALLSNRRERCACLRPLIITKTDTLREGLWERTGSSLFPTFPEFNSAVKHTLTESKS